jgi:hypothetical protein
LHSSLAVIAVIFCQNDNVALGAQSSRAAKALVAAATPPRGAARGFGDCPSRKPLFWPAEHPARPHKSPTENRLTMGIAKATA